MEGRQVLKQHLVARAVRRIKIDFADLQQREVALAVLGWADEAGNRIAGAQVEAPDLARTDVDVVGAGKKMCIRDRPLTLSVKPPGVVLLRCTDNCARISS